MRKKMVGPLGQMELFRNAKFPSRPTFYFIGSAVSAMGVTGLPKWDAFVNGLMTGLGRCAGLHEQDIELVKKLDNYRQEIKKGIALELKNHPGARPSYLENYHVSVAVIPQKESTAVAYTLMIR
jgi:hypothetical protein